MFVGPSSWLLRVCLVCACVRVCVVVVVGWPSLVVVGVCSCGRLAWPMTRCVRCAWRRSVAVAVRLREACRRPFWVGLVWGYGVGVKGAEIGCGGFLWGRLVCVSARAGGGGVSIGSTSPWWGLVLWVSGAWLCARPCVLCLLGWSSSVVSVWLGSA